jgi:hypothetical protein
MKRSETWVVPTPDRPRPAGFSIDLKTFGIFSASCSAHSSILKATGDHMTDKDVKLTQAVETLVEQAAEVLDLAKGQRAAADKQQDAVDRLHVNAHKLEVVGTALKDDVAVLKRAVESPAEK